MGQRHIEPHVSGMIEPALTASEWSIYERMGEDTRLRTVGDVLSKPILFPVDVSRAIAALNFSLPDSDPRKITRTTIDAIREGAFDVEYERGRGLIKSPQEASDELAKQLFSIADALESYLPPTEGT